MRCLCRYFSTELYVIYEVVLRRKKKSKNSRQLSLKLYPVDRECMLHYSVRPMFGVYEDCAY